MDNNDSDRRKVEPWTEFPNIWATKAKFMSWVRGGVRRGMWEKHPVKMEFYKKNRQRIKNPNPNGNKEYVWGAVCAFCHGEFTQKEIQVDHKKGNIPLRDIDDLLDFVDSLIMIRHDDLQFACRSCHECKSYSDRHNITFEEARTEKRAIEYCKLPVEQLKEIIEPHFLPAKNAKERRESIKKLIEKGEIE